MLTLLEPVSDPAVTSVLKEQLDDPDPLDPNVCGDSDSDTCDDCSQAGNPQPDNDGQDSDGDGLCDAGDPDDGQ